MDDKLLSELVKLSSQLPAAALSQLVQLLEASETCSGFETALRWEFGENRLVHQFLNILKEDEHLSLKDAALALRTAQLSRQEWEETHLSLVWSGPKALNIPMRRTGQVILELIDEAEAALFISSFAVYKIPKILERLEAAVRRGVAVSMLLETPQSSHYKIKQDPLELFSEMLREKITFLIWPYKNRVTNEDGTTGSLHAKFILQDLSKLFVSSANLTESAMDLNIELGVLIEDTKIIRSFDDQLQRLMMNDVITKV